MPRSYPLEMRDRVLELVCAGWSFAAAGRDAGVSATTSARWWAESGRMDISVRGGVDDRAGVEGRGGGEPVVVSASGRIRRLLTSEDRAVIAAGLRLGQSHARIGASIGRDRVTIYKEIRRNRGEDGSYSWAVADRAASERRKRPKPTKLEQNPALRQDIEDWMDVGWSPGLIAAMLAKAYGLAGKAPLAAEGYVCAETIYQELYVQTRGSLRADLCRKLSLKRRQRKPRGRGCQVFCVSSSGF
jgi:IS30 family transposase